MSLFNKDARENQLGASLADRAKINDGTWIDVTDKRFGAVPNNPSFDNTPAFNAAISYAVSNNIHRIKVPPGIYPLNLTIVNSSITIEGSGGAYYTETSQDFKRCTILVPFVGTKPVLTIGTGTSQVSFVNLKDFSIFGNNLSGYQVAQNYGIFIKGVQFSEWHNINVFKCTGNNIHITSGTNAPTQLLRLYNVASEYSQGTNFYAEWGQSWTTSIFMYGYYSISDSAHPTTASNMILDSTGVSMIGCYIDCTDFQNTGILLRNNFGGPGVISGTKLTIDVLSNPQPAIILQYPTTSYDLSMISGTEISFNQGYILYQDGTQYKPRSNGFSRVGLVDANEGIDTSGQLNLYPYAARGSKAVARLTHSLTQTGGGYGTSAYTNTITSFPGLSGIDYQFENTQKHYVSMPMSRTIPLGATALGNGNHYVFWITSTGLLRSKRISNIISPSEYPASDAEGNPIGVVSDSGTTANRPSYPPAVASQFFDTTLGKPIWAKSLNIPEVETLIVSSGATTSGNITINLNGTNVNVAVTAGDSVTTVASKIMALTLSTWTVGGSGTTVTFTAKGYGTRTAPTFTDTGATGVTASISTTTIGSILVWVDSTGTTV